MMSACSEVPFEHAWKACIFLSPRLVTKFFNNQVAIRGNSRA
jgi:hypothetical protein